MCVNVTGVCPSLATSKIRFHNSVRRLAIASNIGVLEYDLIGGLGAVFLSGLGFSAGGFLTALA